MSIRVFPNFLFFQVALLRYLCFPCKNVATFHKTRLFVLVTSWLKSNKPCNGISNVEYVITVVLFNLKYKHIIRSSDVFKTSLIICYSSFSICRSVCCSSPLHSALCKPLHLSVLSLTKWNEIDVCADARLVFDANDILHIFVVFLSSKFEILSSRYFRIYH